MDRGLKVLVYWGSSQNSSELLPHNMLETALLACHKEEKFDMSRLANAVGPHWQEACIKDLI